MDFTLTPEQIGIQNAMQRYIENHYTFEQRRRWLRDNTFSREAWKMYAELGLLGLPFPESMGGLGGSSVDVMMVMQAVGEGLLLEPYLATVVLAGTAITLGATGQQQRLLTKIADGTLIMTLAHYEPGGRYRVEHVETQARYCSNRWKLNGRKSAVINAQFADQFIVSGRTSGNASAPNGVGLFIVDRNAQGLTINAPSTHNGSGMATIELDNVCVAPENVLGTPEHALPIIHHVLDRGVAALCAEAVGCMRALLNSTLDHLKTRAQFGRPIGQFQALQHRAAEMLICLEQARAMAMLAAAQADDRDAVQRGKAVSGAKAFVGRAAQFVAEQAVQLHGAMGLTEEFHVGHYFKRLILINSTLGDCDYHLERFGELSYSSL